MHPKYFQTIYIQNEKKKNNRISSSYSNLKLNESQKKKSHLLFLQNFSYIKSNFQDRKKENEIAKSSEKNFRKIQTIKLSGIVWKKDNLTDGPILIIHVENGKFSF